MKLFFLINFQEVMIFCIKSFCLSYPTCYRVSVSFHLGTMQLWQKSNNHVIYRMRMRLRHQCHARLLKVQFTSNEGMSNDAPIHECESEIDHYTGHYVPCSLRRVCGFFNVPQIFLSHVQGLVRRGPRFIVLIREDQKVKPLADVFTKAALSLQLFKDPECWSGRGLNPRPPVQQTDAYPFELTGRRLVYHLCIKHSCLNLAFDLHCQVYNSIITWENFEITFY